MKESEFLPPQWDEASRRFKWTSRPPDYAATPDLSKDLKIRRDREDVAEWLVANSLGCDPSRLILRRYLPTQLYVATDKGHGDENLQLMRAFDGLLRAANFEEYESELELGSLHVRGTYRTITRKTAKELDDSLTLIQLALTQSFKTAGLQVDTKPADRKALARAEAELKKIVAEIEQAEAEVEKARAEFEQAQAYAEKANAHRKLENAEAFKARSEGVKALAEAADKIAKMFVRLGVAFGLVIGTLHISGYILPKTQPDKPLVEFKVNSHKLTPKEMKQWTGSIWVHLPEEESSAESE